MEKTKKVFTNIYIYFLVTLFFILWLVSFMANNDLLKVNFDIESAGFIVIGIIVFIVLTFIKDTFYMMPILVYTPFVFARGFNETNIPLGFYLVIGFAVLGIIIHVIRFRARLKFGSYFIGFAVFLLGIILGGIEKEVIISNLLLLIVGGLLILIAYSFIVTYLNKHDFSDLATIMTGLGLILVFESFAQQYLLYPDSMFINKTILVGWGLSNNIALMLLMCIPFTVYLSVKNKNILSLIYVALFITFLGFIVLNYSRGAIIVVICTLPIIMLYAFISSKHKISYTFNVIFILTLLIIGGVIAYNKDTELFDSIIVEITKVDFDSLNGRGQIYEKMLGELKDNFWFGKGIFNSPNEDGTDYLWGHNVYIHTIYTLGFFGFLTLIIHLFQKYYLLLKKPSTGKVFTALALFSSGLYGLVDVSYFYLNFMMVMIAVLALVQYEIEE